MSQLKFESMVLAVRAQGINGNDIAECWDGEDFTDLFPLSLKAQDICVCFEEMMGYFASHFFSGKRRVSMIVLSPSLHRSPLLSFVAPSVTTRIVT